MLYPRIFKPSNRNQTYTSKSMRATPKFQLYLQQTWAMDSYQISMRSKVLWHLRYTKRFLVFRYECPEQLHSLQEQTKHCFDHLLLCQFTNIFIHQVSWFKFVVTALKSSTIAISQIIIWRFHRYHSLFLFFFIIWFFFQNMIFTILFFQQLSSACYALSIYVHNK